MRHSLVFLLILGFTVPVYEAQAQPLACGPDDRQCLEESLGLACSQTEATCLDWLQQVQAHNLTENPEWRLIAAAGYAALRDLAGSPEDANRYRELSRSNYSEMLETWPDGYYAAQAYVGMATNTDDRDESIAMMRNAVSADPSNSITAFLFARFLLGRGQDDDYREAADAYRSAYLAQSRGGYYYAASALGLYAGTGQVEKADELRDQVARDSGINGFAEEVVSDEFFQDPERGTVVLETACHRYVIAIFGPETCLNGIDNLVEATRLPIALAERQSIVDVAIPALRGLASMGGGSEAEPRGWHDRFSALLQEWIDSEVATAAVYFYWAGTQSNVNAAVSGYERAVRLAPGNGEYRYRLAREILKQGRFDEAIEHLILARDTLPENSGVTTESVDREILKAESGRDN